MKFRLSNRAAIQTTDPEAAHRLYHEVMGFPVTEYPEGTVVNAGALDIHVNPEPISKGMVLELVVEDVEAARALLQQHGCKVLKWEGAGGVCFMEDPNHVAFNLWQDP